ncbi:hypothetical protein JOC86_000209 [Bacillus pakistanensis]|uniref:Uncharacterized protein n=1 Tax=Rossellomorea pakistanensis TaxID=992288 RepID=A0ABS2N732_9BACI|nr:hypothetical protein [Bacillus pakistanensis]MBM7583672.1 hypothetical protein [Bacillus pakistanensis]
MGKSVNYSEEIKRKDVRIKLQGDQIKATLGIKDTYSNSGSLGHY